jgi:hypothetical protein
MVDGMSLGFGAGMAKEDKKIKNECPVLNALGLA